MPFPGQTAPQREAETVLLPVIHGGRHHQSTAVPALVALYITSAYWFSASTSFANPAVTIARGMTDTFSGILPVHVPMFVATPLIGWLFSGE